MRINFFKGIITNKDQCQKFVSNFTFYAQKVYFYFVSIFGPIPLNGKFVRRILYCFTFKINNITDFRRQVKNIQASFNVQTIFNFHQNCPDFSQYYSSLLVRMFSNFALKSYRYAFIIYYLHIVLERNLDYLLL